MNLGKIISKIMEKDENKIQLASLANIAGADIKFDKGYGTIKINVPADIAHDLTNGSRKYVGGLLLIDRQSWEDATKESEDTHTEEPFEEAKGQKNCNNCGRRKSVHCENCIASYDSVTNTHSTPSHWKPIESEDTE